MPLNPQRIRQHLAAFDFKTLFIEELGWSRPASGQPTQHGGYQQRSIARLAGVDVFEIEMADGMIPDARTRRSVYEEIVKTAAEHVLIFVDGQRTQCVWYWVKRDGKRREPREHWYFKGQPGDLFVSKISAMQVELAEFEQDGGVKVTEAADKLKRALDVERVTKKFYADFQTQHTAFLQYIGGIADERDRRWYASVLLNRLMFIYFLQRKGFLNNGDLDYLQRKLGESQARGDNRYYSEFLDALFFEGFAKTAEKRDRAKAALIGSVPYLNGGLFLRHRIEEQYTITIPDVAFLNLFKLFGHYSWNLDDTPGGDDNELNPDVLGYIFEKYINQKAFGAYYTRTEITDYLCEQTIHRLILDRINALAADDAMPRRFEALPDLLLHLDGRLCRDLLFDVLPNLRLLDPACGSGAFLVAALKTLINVYSAVTGRIEYLNDGRLHTWLREQRANNRSLNYAIKKRIITDNLFGVDLMEEATEIAKLRLFLALVSSVQTVDQLEPLPNIDFNVLPGNSLIGLLQVNPARLPLLGATGSKEDAFERQLAEKNRLIGLYRDTVKRIDDPVALQQLRDGIQKMREAAQRDLDAILLEDFYDLGIKYEQATWDAAKNKEGKPTKRPLQAADVHALHPFHWGYEFDQVMARGGFDAIITNPPWEIFKPQAKEFFQDHSELVTKKKMGIKDFESEQTRLLLDAEIRDAWLAYLSDYPHISAFYRSAPQYRNQISVVNGKKAGTDINLYKLFTEQCYNLLRPGGQCGIVIPSGIYTDLGTKQLREMLFGAAQVSGLFGFENRKIIFENVDSRFKFVVLTFEKGGKTHTFPAAFMRHDVAELDSFPRRGALPIHVDLIRRLSPDSLSVMEFKSDLDVQIAEKMLRFPLLGEKIDGVWNLALTREFDMTNDSHLFRTTPGPGRLPLYEGKMIWHFTHQWSEPKYWVDEREGRADLLRREADTNQLLSYQDYRLGIRSVASNTNERSLICSALPQRVFCGNSVLSSSNRFEDQRSLVFLIALLDSFAVDWMLRNKVTTNINMFYIYQLPIPRLTANDAQFQPIVERAARLICTTPEFDGLWEAVMGGPHPGAPRHPSPAATGEGRNTSPSPVAIGEGSGSEGRQAERARLRAELDGMIAHLYGLTEAEFVHILSTFPLVAQEVKDAALEAYRSFAPNPDDAQVAAMIARGETARVEFKAGAIINPHTGKRDDKMVSNIVANVAGYLNSVEGGTLLIGVHDNGTLNDLTPEYALANPQKRNRDGYVLWLGQTLGAKLGHQNSGLWTISFHSINGSDVCRVSVKPAPAAVYVDGELYVRRDAATQKLNTQQANEYMRRRWGM